MNLNSFFTFLFLSLSFLFSSGQNVSINEEVLVDETKLLKHLKTLSSDIYEGRKTGTKGAVKAKKYIINQFYLLNGVSIIFMGIKQKAYVI